MSFRPAPRAPWHRFVNLQVGLFFLAAGIWLGGVITGRTQVTWIAVGILFLGLILGAIGRYLERNSGGGLDDDTDHAERTLKPAANHRQPDALPPSDPTAEAAWACLREALPESRTAGRLITDLAADVAGHTIEGTTLICQTRNTYGAEMLKKPETHEELTRLLQTTSGGALDTLQIDLVA